MSKYYTDKNGFTAEVGSDWNDEKSDQTLKYLTTPKTKFSKVDNSRVVVANNELTTENQLKAKIEKEEAALNLNPIGKRVLTNMVEHGEAKADDLLAAYDTTTKLFSNKDKTIAFKNVADARKWNGIFEKYSKEVQQVNNSLKPASSIKDYYQSKAAAKPVVKKTINTKPLDIGINIPILENFKRNPSPEEIAAEKRFREVERQINQEKTDRETKGLMSFVPMKNYEPK